MKVIVKAKYLFISINIFLAILIVPSLCNAATYYVDATNGNDSNNGLSESLAWKTIAKVNAIPPTALPAGSAVYFKCGETWREQLTVSSSGSAGSPITFSSYGTGAKPVINGANLVASAWTQKHLVVVINGKPLQPSLPNHILLLSMVQQGRRLHR